jgi:hypothetical protein
VHIMADGKWHASAKVSLRGEVADLPMEVRTALGLSERRGNQVIAWTSYDQAGDWFVWLDGPIIRACFCPALFGSILGLCICGLLDATEWDFNAPPPPPGFSLFFLIFLPTSVFIAFTCHLYAQEAENSYWVLDANKISIVVTKHIRDFGLGCCVSGTSVQFVPLENITHCRVDDYGSICQISRPPVLYVTTFNKDRNHSCEYRGLGLRLPACFSKAVLDQRGSIEDSNDYSFRRLS